MSGKNSSKRGTKNPWGMYPKEEKFCRLVAGGASQREAVREAYAIDNDRNDGWKAYDLMKKERIQNRIKDIMMEEYAPIALEVHDRIAVLGRIALYGDKEADRIKAVDTLNKMTGVYIEKHEVKHTGQIISYLPEKEKD